MTAWIYDWLTSPAGCCPRGTPTVVEGLYGHGCKRPSLSPNLPLFTPHCLSMNLTIKVYTHTVAMISGVGCVQEPKCSKIGKICNFWPDAPNQVKFDMDGMHCSLTHHAKFATSVKKGSYGRGRNLQFGRCSYLLSDSAMLPFTCRLHPASPDSVLSCIYIDLLRALYICYRVRFHKLFGLKLHQECQ